MATVMKKVKLEASTHYSEIQVKEEPISIVKHERFTEHQDDNDDTISESEYIVEEEDEEYTEYEIDIEIPEESIAENYVYDPPTQIAYCRNEAILPHSHAIEVMREEYFEDKLVDERSVKFYKQEEIIAEESYINEKSYRDQEIIYDGPYRKEKSYREEKLIAYEPNGDDYFTYLAETKLKTQSEDKLNNPCIMIDSIHNHTNSLQQNIHNNIFKCSKCEFQTNNHEKLTLHIEKHSIQKNYKCTKCNFSTLSTSAFKNHLRRHSDVMPYRCTECNFRFLHQRGLDVHIKEHRNKMPFKCADCGYCAESLPEFELHVRMHFDKNLLKCDECYFTAQSHMELAAHRKEHTAYSSPDLHDEDLTVFKSRKKRSKPEDEEYRPRTYKIEATGVRETRQGLYEPDLRRALFESKARRRKNYVKKKELDKQLNKKNQQPCSTSSGILRKGGPYKKPRTAKQRLAKIMKIR